MKQDTIAVLFGGCSSEYSVSLESAAGVLRNLDRTRFAPVMIGITRAGDWYHFTGDVGKIEADTWCNPDDCSPAMFSPNRSAKQLLVLHDTEVSAIKVDAAFPVLHGKNGEDGTVQGLLELAGIPIVGCGALASALCMDKHRAHLLAETAGVRVPRAFVLSRTFAPEHACLRAEQIGYPLFVKPVRAGSSFGVTRVAAPEELLPAIGKAFTYDDTVIVEEAIAGFEVGCAVMGTSQLTAGAVDEIELAGGFFDFTEKYHLITSSIHVPARISQEKADEIRSIAKRVYRVLGCNVLVRVDLFLTPRGEVVFNEVNTIPGFTAHSRFPSMMREAGVPFTEVITRAIEMAVGV